MAHSYDPYRFLDSVDPSLFGLLTKKGDIPSDNKTGTITIPQSLLIHNRKRECRNGVRCRKQLTNECLFRHTPNYCLNFFLYDKCDCKTPDNGYHVNREMFNVLSTTTLETLVQMKERRRDEREKREIAERKRQQEEYEALVKKNQEAYATQMKKYEEECKLMAIQQKIRQEKEARIYAEKQAKMVQEIEEKRRQKLKDIQEPEYVDLSDPTEYHSIFPFSEKYITNMILDYMKTGVSVTQFISSCGCEGTNRVTYSKKYYDMYFTPSSKEVCSHCFKHIVSLHLDCFASYIEFPFGGEFLGEIQIRKHKGYTYQDYNNLWDEIVGLVDMIRKRRIELTGSSWGKY